MKNVLVTGGNGQLGQCLNDYIKGEKEEYCWLFTDYQELDITNEEQVENFISEKEIDIVINCAAYTDVNKAETEEAKASLINIQGPQNLAESCNRHNAVLIHISTDYVFDGYNYKPYTPQNKSNLHTSNVYGETKLQGEIAIQNSGCKYFIFRTSWLYSTYGKNFVKTMINKFLNNETVKVVCDQIGSPTCAHDLAWFLYEFVTKNKYSSNNGIYHFSNKGVASWYDFAFFIYQQLIGKTTSYITSCKTEDFASSVIRPYYSVLDTSLTETTFKFSIPNWMESLKQEISRILKEKENESN